MFEKLNKIILELEELLGEEVLLSHEIADLKDALISLMRIRNRIIIILRKRKDEKQ